jgi:hypothetical protein
LQRMLNFLEMPIPEMQVWETLEEEQTISAITVLARLIAQATIERAEEEHDR